MSEKIEFRTLVETRKAGYFHSTEKHHTCQIIYLLTGELHVQFDAYSTTLKKNHLAVFRLNSSFQINSETGFRIISLFARPRNPCGFEGKAAVCEADRNMQLLSEMILNESRQPTNHSDQLINSLGESLMLLALRATESSGADPLPDYGRNIARQLYSQIQLRPNLGKTIPELIKPLPTSYRQAARYFEKEFDITPKECQIKFRIVESGQLLLNTDMPVTAIAYELGYNSSQHFSTQFKKHTGQTPSEYRRNRSQKTSGLKKRARAALH
jgi:AraC-like DNA-binding protein